MPALSHVVMQAAEFPTTALAQRCEKELRALIDEYVRFEASDPDPWGGKSVPPPLAAFGDRHGVAWPNHESSRFLIKGLFADEAQLLLVDRMVFFWAGGFDLGGETLRAILVKLGASATTREGGSHIAIHHDDPDARVEELAEFLRAEDFEDQFAIDDGTSSDVDACASITVVGPRHQMRVAFDDSGVQDWAFTALLPQLHDEDPTVLR
jgi:hypothetical protein